MSDEDKLFYTADERRIIAEKRAEQAQIETDIAALTSIAARAIDAGERHTIERMIERRGGPKVVHCACGLQLPAYMRYECNDCYSRGYDK